MLAQNKIFANEKLMLIHLISFNTITICAIIIETMIITGALEVREDIDDMNKRQKRILFAEIIIEYIACTAQIGVVVTMMIMFTKHSQTISKA